MNPLRVVTDQYRVGRAIFDSSEKDHKSSEGEKKGSFTGSAGFESWVCPSAHQTKSNRDRSTVTATGKNKIDGGKA
jgi:hypothetical protein